MINILVKYIIVPLFTGIIASLSSVLLLHSIKPRIEISSKIAKQKDSRGKTYFGVKVVNKSKSAIKNINVSWEILIPQNVPGGVRYETITLKLRKERTYIEGKRENKNVYIFNTEDNIQNLWSDSRHMYVLFRIYCEHAVFSTGKLFKQKYMFKKNDIIDGTFEAGDSMKII